ncbi:MAG: riboflavin synthase [Patescibacteria group bacterium]|nr:riboflavin synthase [Patescibacteria group bacterium]
MFTGIIRHQGKITGREGARLVISVPRNLARKLQPGGSLAVNGVCLTAESKIKNSELRTSLMPETARVTTLGKLPVGSQVNLELPLKLSDPLDGHLVQGHVDGIGAVTKIMRQGQSRRLEITLPRSIAHLVASKGSIAIDGVSLTVVTIHRNHFTIGLIPETLKRTTLGNLRVGDSVNLEADLVARYLQRLGRR